MACNREYLPLCSIPAGRSRDGVAGANASIYIPFLGIYFFSGETFTDPNATAAQDQKTYIGGVTRGNTFSKNACGC